MLEQNDSDIVVEMKRSAETCRKLAARATMMLLASVALFVTVGTMIMISSGILPSLLNRINPVADKPAPKPLMPITGMRISPGTFFTPETKRLEPHLGFSAKCFEIQSATKGMIKCELVLWDGENMKVLGSGETSLPEQGEVTFSIQPSKENTHQFRVVAAIATPTGYSSSSRTISIPDHVSTLGQTIVAIDSAKDIAFNTSKAILAVIWGDSITTNSSSDIELQAKKFPGALILKVTPMSLTSRITVDSPVEVPD